MVNMSTDDAPCLSPRKGRWQLTEYGAATMLLHKDGKPLVIDGTAAKFNDGGAEIVVYDTEKGIWAREDETEAVGFSGSGGVLYLLDSDGALWACGTNDSVA